jgi:hypothetical protein
VCCFQSDGLSPYYRQDDPRTAGAMDTYFRDALQTYVDVTYKHIHDYLARRFHACQCSSHQAQQLSVQETLSWVQWCQLKAWNEQLHPLRNPGSA